MPRRDIWLTARAETIWPELARRWGYVNNAGDLNMSATIQRALEVAAGVDPAHRQ